MGRDGEGGREGGKGYIQVCTKFIQSSLQNIQTMSKLQFKPPNTPKDLKKSYDRNQCSVPNEPKNRFNNRHCQTVLTNFAILHSMRFICCSLNFGRKLRRVSIFGTPLNQN